MKKFLLTLFVALATISASAKTVTINAAALPITQDGIKVSGTAEFGTTLKAIAGETITVEITKTGATITAIKLTGNKLSSFTCESGYDGTDTWKGSATSVTFNGAGTKLNAPTVSAIDVTYTEAAGTGTFDDLYVPFKYDGVNYYDVKNEWENPVIDSEKGKSEITFTSGNIDFLALGGAVPNSVTVESADTPFEGWTAGWADVKWNRSNKNLDDLKTKFFAYVVGTGNPVVQTTHEYIEGNSGNVYRPAYVYYGPYSKDTITTVNGKQYMCSLPSQGLYYEFAAKKDGKLKIAVWANKGNRNTWVIDKETMVPVSFTCEGYFNATTEPDGTTGKNKLKWLNNDEIATLHDLQFKRTARKDPDTGEQVKDADGNVIYDPCDDTYPYVIGAGNQPFFGYLNMNLKKGQTYLLFQDSSQIGFGGFEFTDGTPADGDLFSAEASVFLPSYIKAITNLVYNGDETFTSTAGTEATVQFTDSCTQYTLKGIKGTVTVPTGWTATPANDGSTVVVTANEGTSAKYIVTFTTEAAETFSITNDTPAAEAGIRELAASASSTVTPRKVLVNGQILIGKYNIAGQRVK